jgi:hypothetical protein
MENNIRQDSTEVLDKLLASEETLVRAELAKQGYKLDVLVNDTSDIVRREVAKQGYGLDMLVKDKSSFVRKEVARKGYGLDILVNDEDSDVRWVVAHTTEDIDLLLHLCQDGNLYVRDSASTQLVSLGHTPPETDKATVLSFDAVIDEILKLEKSLKSGKDELAHLTANRYVAFRTLKRIRQISEEIVNKKIIEMFPRFEAFSINNAFMPLALAEELKKETNFSLYKVDGTSIFVVFYWERFAFCRGNIRVYAPAFTDVIDDKKRAVECSIDNFLADYNERTEYGKHLQWLYKTQKGDFIDKATAAFPENNEFVATLKYAFKPSFRKELKRQIPVYEQLVKNDKENFIADSRKSIERKKEEIEITKKQASSVVQELLESDLCKSLIYDGTDISDTVRLYEQFTDIRGNKHIFSRDFKYTNGKVSFNVRKEYDYEQI